jgi:hypothetical protein
VPPYSAPSHSAIISKYISKTLQLQTGHENITLTEMIPSVNWGDDPRYRTTCRVCKVYEETVAAEWSEHFDLDNLIETVIKFTETHRHTVYPTDPPERVFRLD